MRTIRVEGLGRKEVRPDMVTLSFDVEMQELTYADCIKNLNNHTEQLRTDMVACGLKRRDIKSSDFRIRPSYETVNQNNKLFIGYKGSHCLKVSFPFKKALLDTILSRLAERNSGVEVEISFSAKNKESVRRAALTRAVENARENAKTLSEAANVQLVKLHSIDYGWNNEVVYDRSSLCITQELQEPNIPGADIDPENEVMEERVVMVWEVRG